MKLFKYICGRDEKFGAAKDETDAFDKRVEVDATFAWLPVEIEEVKVDGYTITLTPIAGDVNAMDRDQLKAYLDSKGIEYTPQLGEDKLRKLALNA